MSRILLIVPTHPKLHTTLQQTAFALAHRMILANPHHDMGLWMDFRITKPEPNETDLARLIRSQDRSHLAVKMGNAETLNRAAKDNDLTCWDYVMLIDADVVEYPMDMPDRLLANNPTGITAPLPLIEGSARLYDWLAFIMKGRDHIEPENSERIWGRNLQHEYPYWFDENGQPCRPATPFVEMDCVGMVLMMPAWLLAKYGYRYHPAFSGHYHICKMARLEGLTVGCQSDCVAFHADLPKYGQKWHEHKA